MLWFYIGYILGGVVIRSMFLFESFNYYVVKLYIVKRLLSFDNVIQKKYLGSMGYIEHPNINILGYFSIMEAESEC